MLIPPACAAVCPLMLRSDYGMMYVLLTALLPDAHPASTRATASVLFAGEGRGVREPGDVGVVEAVFLRPIHKKGLREVVVLGTRHLGKRGRC